MFSQSFESMISIAIIPPQVFFRTAKIGFDLKIPNIGYRFLVSGCWLLVAGNR